MGRQYFFEFLFSVAEEDGICLADVYQSWAKILFEAFDRDGKRGSTTAHGHYCFTIR